MIVGFESSSLAIYYLMLVQYLRPVSSCVQDSQSRGILEVVRKIKKTPTPTPKPKRQKQVKSKHPHTHTKNPKISKIERHISKKKLLFGADANLTSN